MVSVLKMSPVAEAVNIPFVAQFIDEDDVFHPNEVLEQAADAMLDEMAKLEAVLRPLRTPVAVCHGARASTRSAS